MLRVNPKSIDKINPIYEIRENFEGKGRVVIIYLIVSLVISDFISGLLYQWFYNIFSDIGITRNYGYRSLDIGILDSFKYGIKAWYLTLILFLIICKLSFRIFRALKKDYVKNYDDNYLKSNKETYGGAHFQTKEEMEKNGTFKIYKSIEETTGDVFGTDDEGNIYEFVYPPGLNRNKVFIGAPGSGKSAAIMKTSIYQNIRRGISMVVTDSKGDLYAQTSAVARKYKYDVKMLNIKPKEFKNSNAINLFCNLHPDDVDLDSKADTLANVIIKNTTSDMRDAENYWGSNEFNLIKCVIMYVASDPVRIRERRNTLPEARDFLSSHNPKTMAAVFLNIPKTNPMRQCYDIFANCSEINQGQIINGAAIRLSKLSNIYLREVLSHNEIDFIAPMRHKCLYYVVISDTDDAYKFVSSLFFSVIFNEMCDYSDSLTEEQKKKQLNVEFLCDEYANTGGIYGLSNKITSVRSRKIGITLILQGKEQLDTMYTESETKTILNACPVKGLLSTNDPDTAKYFSDFMGDTTVLVENNRFYEQSDDIIHARMTIQKTTGEGNRQLRMPQELMNEKFTSDQILYLISAQSPVLLKKYFSEKSGEAIHPMEKEGRELGERKCNRHRPKWRKEMEEKNESLQDMAGIYQEDSSTGTPDPSLNDFISTLNSAMGAAIQPEDTNPSAQNQSCQAKYSAKVKKPGSTDDKAVESVKSNKWGAKPKTDKKFDPFDAFGD